MTVRRVTEADETAAILDLFDGKPVEEDILEPGLYSALIAVKKIRDTLGALVQPEECR